MEQLGDVIGRRCRELGLSQTALAERVGVHVRQIRRYERGEQQPVLGVAVRLAATLGVSLDELAGVAGPRLALTGEWWAARQMLLDGHDVVAALPLALTQNGTTITAEARGAATWRGELRLWSGPVLTGWYAGAAADSARGERCSSSSTREDDLIGEGRWVGLGADGAIVTGHAALARTREAAQTVIARLSACNARLKHSRNLPTNVASPPFRPAIRSDERLIAVSSFNSSSPAPRGRRLAAWLAFGAVGLATGAVWASGFASISPATAPTTTVAGRHQDRAGQRHVVRSAAP